jgi:hypothetical protein
MRLGPFLFVGGCSSDRRLYDFHVVGALSIYVFSLP